MPSDLRQLRSCTLDHSDYDDRELQQILAQMPRLEEPQLVSATRLRTLDFLSQQLLRSRLRVL